MNVLFYTTAGINHNLGGIEKTTNILSSYFRQMGIGTFHICARDLNDAEDKTEYLVSYIEDNHIDIVIDQHWNEYLTHKTLPNEVKIIRCYHNDVREVNITRRLLGDFRHHFGKEQLMNVLYWLNTPLRRKRQRKSFIDSVRYTDQLVLLSRSYCDYLNRRLNLPLDKMRFVPNAVVRGANDAGKVDPKKKENILLFCGRVVHNPKNVFFLVSLWKRLYERFPSWKMVVCGDGPDKRALEKEAERHGLDNFEIVGYANPDPYYEKAKILVHPSLSEGFGMAVAEAMNNGCVPVVFDVSPAYHEIIDNGLNGIIVGGVNEKDYFQEVARLMDDRGLLETMSRQAMVSSERYRMEIVGKEWLSLFTRLMN